MNNLYHSLPIVNYWQELGQLGRFEIKEGLTNQKFYKLTILSDVTYIVRGNRYVYATCNCGNVVKKVSLSRIINNYTKSCGCKQRNQKPKIIKHGDSGSPLNRIWSQMKKRCNNPNADRYKFYGALGIKVCKEWSEDYRNFKNWAESNGWKQGLEIDRIDGTKDYSPDNCRIVTHAQNIHNQQSRKNSSSKYKGVSKSKYNTWIAQIGTKDHISYLGSFKTEEEAAIAYNNKAKELFGEYAFINKVSNYE